MTDRPSKSARKREYLALQALGEKLIELSDQELAGIPLEDNLREAIVTARGIRSHGALRRQRQLIGKLMAQADAEPIRDAFQRLGRADRANKAVFHRAEQWRDRILKEGPPALAELANSLGYEPDAVAEASRRYRSSHDDAGRKRAARQLFRAIHDELAAGSQDDRG